MTEWSGFWSYVRDDDTANSGRISQLARDIEAEYAVQTGESITIFLDRDAIEWGENWRQKIDESLAANSFFVAVLTPRYFTRPECRRELRTFVERATHLGVKELVLPVYYVTVPQLEEKDPSDDLMKLIKPINWEDWRDLRFRDPASEEYRREVARLAERLARAGADAQKVDVVALIERYEQDADEGPGSMDRLAAGQQAVEAMSETLASATSHMTLIGELIEKATEDTQKADARGQGFVGRLSVLQRLSRELREPVDGIWSAANSYVSQIHDMDGLVRILVEMAPGAAAKSTEEKTAFCSYFDSVRGFVDAAREGMQSTQGMIDSIAPNEGMSKDLRPQLRRLKQGLTLMVEAQSVTNEWLQLIDATGIVCDEAPPE
jgi:hypothetical protein